jgi:hypothetical protein
MVWQANLRPRYQEIQSHHIPINCLLQSSFWNKHTFNQCLVGLDNIYQFKKVEEITLLQTVLYELTPWSWVILEKLTAAQLLNTFLAFSGTWRFITMFSTAHHWTLSWASQIQPTSSHYFFHTDFRIILHLCQDLARSHFSSISLSSAHISDLSHVCYMLHQSHLFDLIILINENLPWNVHHLHSTYNSNYLNEEGTEFLILWYVH